MKIIITAAGLGSRFRKTGINKPKYSIIANNKTLLYWSMISLKKFFNEDFIFIFQKQTFNKTFIHKELAGLGIKNYKIVLISKTTDGQATTVLKASKYLKPADSIMIYNIDTHVNEKSLNKQWFKYDGLIITTNASGSHWSFASCDKNEFATKVTEKIKISDHASIGLYYFKKFSDFKSIYKDSKSKIIKQYKEMFICPMYQYLIDKKRKILVKDIPLKSLICLGTPDEVMLFDKKFLQNN